MCAPESPGSPPTPKVFIVPQKEYEIIDTWHVAGMKATGSCDVKLAKQFVHQDFCYDLSDLLNGTTSSSSTVVSRNAKWPMAPVVAFSGVGTALGGTRRAIQIYGERLVGFNAPAPGQMPPGAAGVRGSAIVRYSDLNCRLFMVEGLLKSSIEHWKTKSAAGAVSLQDRADARVHCTKVVHECRDIIHEVLDCMGSRAQYEDHELQRIARDVSMVYSHVLLDHDGANEIAGRLLLGMPHNTLLI
jgi:alkylation response protein AidB-like acyl-CoA dehydrogenase